MEYILALVLSAILTVAFMFYKKNKTIFIKPRVATKDELIQNYRDELLELLEKNKENKDLQFQEKIKFIKRVNYELSMNIFFDEIEAKNLIQELSSLGK
jgi:hypothetical protein